MTRILIVDDEPNIIELARMYLEREGYNVDGVNTGKDAILRHNTIKPDLIILDLMLPDTDGFEICRQIRATAATPILMLTARKDDMDKIVGLEMGADDYLTKPFNPRELIARVKAILRRYRSGPKPTTVKEFGKLRIDADKREVTVSGRPVILRTKEFDLLNTLTDNMGIVFSREKLLEVVWGFDFYGETRTVDVHVNHLRDKLAGAGIKIETLRGTGYKMTVDEEMK